MAHQFQVQWPEKVSHFWLLNVKLFLAIEFETDTALYFTSMNIEEIKTDTTGGPRIVLFLRTQGTVLLTKPYYSGTDLVLK